ncbi:magnesium-translocating P-type ATPase [Qipengyuania zhejiangensis]|uniref:magnesium-translocating P-type ATPase n=1 Tax=Qipengyuania zhejiangensis TaxID=3077782 RepID=UPI002D796C8E|nr:magnesium-translocating P-type ATPase [Qipengyuania sp. Z2]
MKDEFWQLPVDQALRLADSSPSGLTVGEAERRLAEDGPNSLQDRHSAPVLALLGRQFKSPLVLILLFGALVAAFLREWMDAAIILAIVVGSGILSFSQEFRASRAMEALRGSIALRARALRGGTEAEVPVKELVRGDLVRLSAGNLVPADGLVIEAQDCLVTQAALTGESMPVEKAPGLTPKDTPAAQRSNWLFMGSSLRSGTATMLVLQRGQETQFGAIAQSLQAGAEESDFARGVRKFGAMLMRVMIVIVIAVLTANQLLGRPAIDSLLFAVALAVGLSPELLPAIISVTLSAGAQRLSKRGVIVRRLEAVENLGSMNLLCTDKTGTLTQGVVMLDAAIDPSGAASDTVLRAAFLNSHFESGIANPLDEAIVAAGKRAGQTGDGCRKLGEIPYDFSRRRLSIAVAGTDAADKALLVTKGAYAEVVSVCSHIRIGSETRLLSSQERLALDALFRKQGEAGYRVLALAEREIAPDCQIGRDTERDMVLTGLLLFRDPPKEDAAQTIRELAELGIATKVISGDNRYVTAHVASEVGLDPKSILTGEAITRMSSAALQQRAVQTSIFAEIDPQQKERIIRALQETGNSVGYLGDGINDAPALQLADVGISVEQAVDVARESADLVLLEKDLGVIAQGIVSGRRTFANTLKYISITTSANFGNMVSMAVATPLLPFLPLLPKQILLNNFLSDVPAAAISSDKVDEERIDTPQRWDVKSIQRFMIVFGLLSSLFDLVTFAALRLVMEAGETEFQTIWFVISLLTELVVLLILRTRRFSFASRPSALLVWLTVVLAVAAVAMPYLPAADWLFGLYAPSVRMMLFCSLIVAAYALSTEIAKRFYFRRFPGG